MVSVESFSELLGLLYSAPLHPENWSRFLDLLCQHTRSRSSFLICADSRAGLSVRCQGGVPYPESVLKTYAASYAKTDPFLLPLVRAGKTGVIDCDAILPRQELERSEHYRTLNEPAGYRYPALAALTLSVRRFEAISFWRTEEEGYMDAEAVRLLDLLVPHLQSAMEVRQALGSANARAADADTIADAIATPTFLLEADGHIVHANTAALELLQLADGLVSSHGLLSTAKRSMQKPLQTLLKSVHTSTGTFARTHQSKPLSLDRPSGRRPLQLLASPLFDQDAGRVLLIATDPEKPVLLRDDVLREHYQLTAAETDVANGLLTGYSLVEIAALRRVKVGTVRDQVKSMLAKTGTARQTDMVRLLMTLPQIT